jgi:hypothetical protein
MSKSAQSLELSTAAYAVEFDRQKPWQVTIKSGTGAEVARLFLGSAVDTALGWDELLTVEAPTLNRSGEITEVVFRGSSSRWEGKQYILRCLESEVTYRVEVAGRGRIKTCRLLSACLRPDLRALGLGESRFRAGYQRPFGDLCRGSVPRFGSYLTARPTAAERDQRPLWESDEIDLVDDPLRHGGCDSFLPAPWCWSLEPGEGEPWTSLGLAPEPDALQFGAVRLRSASSFGIELEYGGRVQVEGRWASPELVFCFGARDADLAVRQQVAALAARGLVQCPTAAPPGWWLQPVFDASEQQAWQAGDRAPESESSLANMLDALALLAHAGLRPPVIWLGPGWMGDYGQPDALRWPDLAGFIARQHQDRRRVILPWPLFGPDAPENDAAVAELAANAVKADGFDADGLRLCDVTPPDGSVARLHTRIAAVRTAVKAARSDALLIAPTVNPYFAHLVDMVTLGSLQTDRSSVLPMVRHRAEIARIASPGWLLAVTDAGVPTIEAWQELVTVQGALGVPVLSHAEGLPVPREPLTRDDLARVAAEWAEL